MMANNAGWPKISLFCRLFHVNCVLGGLKHVCHRLSYRPKFTARDLTLVCNYKTENCELSVCFLCSLCYLWWLIYSVGR